MLVIALYQIDAFSDKVFGGNPACICPLDAWRDDQVLQAIAMENAVAETAFFVKDGDHFHLRWFTPEIEMDLCGHATLASAHVIWQHLGYQGDEIVFSTKSGILRVSRNEELMTLDFPSRPPLAITPSELVLNSFNLRPKQILKARDYVLIYEHEDEIRHMVPNKAVIDQLYEGPGGVIITAPGRQCDFVSRFFVPQCSVFEDPVTGSAHCSLIPYWAQILGKTQLSARQLSARGGVLSCELRGDRVLISGTCVTYLKGEIWL